MIDKSTSIFDLVSRFGKFSVFASWEDCGYEATHYMRFRESIALELWPNVVAASPKRGIQGVTIEWLADRRALAGKQPEPAQ